MIYRYRNAYQFSNTPLAPVSQKNLTLIDLAATKVPHYTVYPHNPGVALQTEYIMGCFN